ncbi:Os06g0167500 [Oryza sativa Japonica Group]|uniref:Os06g0167500 protein n=1 Tax=Oryza sativa subsp. japonica TaxID=39947 RepID=A0A0P0WTH4_ORYSJ|nr:Os06g0167500 [Oryza sativa Japonica Group]
MVYPLHIYIVSITLYVKNLRASYFSLCSSCLFQYYLLAKTPRPYLQIYRHFNNNRLNESFPNASALLSIQSL